MNVETQTGRIMSEAYSTEIEGLVRHKVLLHKMIVAMMKVPHAYEALDMEGQMMAIKIWGDRNK